MISFPFFRKEVLEDISSRRSLLTKFTITIVLALPLTIGSIPIEVRSAIFALTVMFIGVMGSSIGLVKMKEGGMMERLAVVPVSHRRLVTEYLLANSLMDLLQFVIPLLIVLSVSLEEPTGALWMIIALIAAILTANALGVISSVIAGSSGEVHLISIVMVLFIAAGSGLFTTGDVGGLEALSSISPFHLLDRMVLFPWEGTGWTWPIVPMAVALIVPLIAILGSERLFRQ